MTLHLGPEIADGLTALAVSRGLSVEDYLKQLVDRELPPTAPANPTCEGSGTVWEDGLLIYGAGTALPDGFVDDALRRSRDERSQQLLGNNPS